MFKDTKKFTSFKLSPIFGQIIRKSLEVPLTGKCPLKTQNMTKTSHKTNLRKIRQRLKIINATIHDKGNRKQILKNKLL